MHKTPTGGTLRSVAKTATGSSVQPTSTATGSSVSNNADNARTTSGVECIFFGITNDNNTHNNSVNNFKDVSKVKQLDVHPIKSLVVAADIDNNVVVFDYKQKSAVAVVGIGTVYSGGDIEVADEHVCLMARWQQQQQRNRLHGSDIR